MPADSPRDSIAIAITGASGALYATRTLAALLERGCHVELIVTEYGRRLLRDELGESAAVEKLGDYLTGRYGDGVRRGTFTLYSNRDLGARIASGSQDCRAMVVVPCSMKTLAGIAHGLSRTLTERAADVMLKERRTLVIVPRETPMSLPQLRNMRSRRFVLPGRWGITIRRTRRKQPVFIRPVPQGHPHRPRQRRHRRTAGR